VRRRAAKRRAAAPRLRLPVLLLALLMALASPTAPATPGATATAAPDDGPVLEPSPMNESYPGDPLVELRVSYQPRHLVSRVEGTITLELFIHMAPITVNNFLDLTSARFYDGTKYHRVIDDFVIQGGDPNTKDSNPIDDGSGGSGESIPLEIDANLTHVDGAIGMAREMDPDTAESQFYICDGEQHQLDDAERQQRNPPERGYAVFGVVRDGMSHVRAIAATPTTNDPGGEPTPRVGTGLGDRPIYDAVLLSVRIVDWIPYPPLDDDTEATEPQAVAAAVGLALLGGIVMARVTRRH